MFSSDRFLRTATGALVAEASDLGFQAGRTPPRRLMIDRVTYARVRTVWEDGEVVGWDYVGPDQAKVAIFNE